MNIENIKILLSCLILIFYFLIKIIKILIERKQIKTIKNKQLVDDQLLLLVQQAETLFENGIDKKQFVLNAIDDFLVSHKINVSSLEVENMLEEIINISKTINFKGE